MDWFEGVVLYVLIWWTALFAVLPFGTRPDPNPDPASGWRGAPTHPHLLRKVIATTIVSAILWAGCAAIINSKFLSFRHGWLALPDY